MHHFDIRKWTQLAYVVLMVAMAVTWTGCAPTTSTALCGNGVVEAGEDCDPPDGDTCDTDCTIIADIEPVCGDSVIDPGEDCDPPDGISCDAACQTISVGGAVCGNSVVEAGEDCDPPGGETCDADCQRISVDGAVCGNSAVEAGEDCDPPDGETCDENCQTIPVDGADCGNSVVEAGEDCDPPNGATCDANCQAINGVVPVCGDSVIDPGESCDPPNDVTCDQACQTIRIPAVCGNDVVEEGERCEPPNTGTCDSNCQTISTGGSVCGNGIVEPGEQCDPPTDNTCDLNCQDTTGGELANDSCTSPTAITEGSRSFSNVGATTDGPEACAPFDNPDIDSDIWYCFTAPCTDGVTVSLCGSGYDTKMAVYLGCDCPDSDDFWLGCSDDNCGAGQESRLTFPGLAGQDYLVRIGGFRGFDDEQGPGSLAIFCDSDPDFGLGTCAPGAGDCLADNGTPGCSDVTLCQAVCAVDMSCCDRMWDDLCATKADGIENGFDGCGPGNGSCTEDEGTAGCDDPVCCQSVCVNDPFCCLNRWDQVCADAVPETCGAALVCADARGTCFAEHDTPGCLDLSCCLDVCETDSLCCSSRWDEICTGIAESSDSCEP